MARKRKTSPRGKHKRTGTSEALRKKWADPVYREKLIARRKFAQDYRKANNIPYPTRMGVPDGMRKAEALEIWAQARAYAKRFIEIMEEKELVEKVTVPGSEEEMAKKTLEEAFVMAVGPLTDAKTKSAYMRIVLDFTKSKPETKSKLTLDNSAEWLAALQADMPKKPDGISGTE